MQTYRVVIKETFGKGREAESEWAAESARKAAVAVRRVFLFNNISCSIDVYTQRPWGWSDRPRRYVSSGDQHQRIRGY